jgi:hypothetical protein
MKNHSLIIFSFIAVLAISSCKKDSNNNTDVVTVAAMSVSIDGAQWTSLTRVTVLTNDVFTITGASLTGEVILLVINGSTEGTYNLPALSNLCACTYKGSPTADTEDWYTGITGSVNLEKVDKVAKTISGKFQFSLVKGVTTKTISSGVFTNLSYTTTN